MINKLMTKLNQWFSEPLGNTLPSDSAETELKKPFKSFEESKLPTKATRGRGDKREVPNRIEEFHPRGAAGHREGRGPRGASKAVMPHQGNRSRNPK